MLSILQVLLISLLYQKTTIGNEYFLQKIWVSKQTIIQKILTSTITSCHLKCQMRKDCSTIGLQENVVNKELPNTCYLLKKIVLGRYKKKGDTPIYAVTDKVIKYICVDGGYGEWLAFGPCTRLCGSGVQTRKRLCNNPAPQGDGRPCQGAATESRICNTHDCPTIYCRNALDDGNDTAMATSEGVTEEVKCQLIDNHKYTVFSHTAEVMHSYTKPNYNRFDKILYLNNTLEFIRGFVLQSAYCIQRFHFQSFENERGSCLFKTYGGSWVNFDHSLCRGCTAVVNEKVKVNASAYISHRHWLPLIGMQFTDNDQPHEYMNITLDKLFCR